MASITIRNLDDRIKRRLRIRAAQHGRSMEDAFARYLAPRARGDDEPVATLQSRSELRVAEVGRVRSGFASSVQHCERRRISTRHRGSSLTLNVVSDLMRPEPAPSVEVWLSGLDASQRLSDGYQRLAELRYAGLHIAGGQTERRYRRSCRPCSSCSTPFWRRELPCDVVASRELRRNRRRASWGRASDQPIRLPDRGDCAVQRGSARNEQHQGSTTRLLAIELFDPWRCSNSPLTTGRRARNRAAGTRPRSGSRPE